MFILSTPAILAVLPTFLRQTRTDFEFYFTSYLVNRRITYYGISAPPNKLLTNSYTMTKSLTSRIVYDGCELA
jgi:hypothetical protein